MKKTNKYLWGLFSAVLGVVLWITSCVMNERYEYVIRWVKNIFLMQSATKAAFLTAFFIMVITHVGIILEIAGLTGLLHGKAFTEGLQQQTRRNPLFFAALPFVLLINAWNIVWPFLPAKGYDYVPPVPEIDLILDVFGFFSNEILYFMVCANIIAIVTYSHNILPNMNYALSGAYIILLAGGIYTTAYVTVPYFGFSVGLLILVVVSLASSAAMFITYKTTNRKPLTPAFEVVIIPYVGIDDEEIYEKPDETDTESEGLSLLEKFEK